MFIKNLKEDLVIKVLEDVLKDLKDVCKCSICVEDIVTYVLNRTKPFYISSGRGILHLEADLKIDIQDKTDIYSLVLQAINIIKDRRKSHLHSFPQNGIEILRQEEYETTDFYYVNFPYILGRVLDYVSLKPKDGVKVELYIYDNEQDKYVLAPMKEQSWSNPYIVPIRLGGYYTFWPKEIKAKEQSSHTKEKVNFKIGVNDEYEEEFTLELFTDKIIRNYISTNFSYELNPILI
ncbi:MAG TPA: late competence development ComFB family protein [Spirochaetota bacterium]|nr:late competence development ComFB family protein [Spirochaetota bacterium]HOM37904.1 late competence development ComFB family protein [Spirochaetota bacterium]HPQ48708.1 late competence development ComFB family protein [Spirochaetota bacterium]